MRPEPANVSSVNGHYVESTPAVRPPVLPRDAFAHPEAQTEWWYYSGYLDAGERRFAFMLSFFRRETAGMRTAGLIPLRLFSRTVHMAHLVLSDLAAGAFYSSQWLSFNGRSPPAWTATDRYDIRLGHWRAWEDLGRHRLAAASGRARFAAELRPLKPAALFGDGGVIDKGEGRSCYMSWSRMAGTAELALNGDTFRGPATAWMDHEYGRWRLRPWRWFGLQLADGRELMVYLIGGQGGAHEYNLVETSGQMRRLEPSRCRLTPVSVWRSPSTGLEYESGWHLTVPEIDADLRIEPMLAHQEFDARATTPIVYWEGPVSVSGRAAGRPAEGRGFAELIGEMGDVDNISLRALVTHIIPRPRAGSAPGQPHLDVRTK